MPDDTDNLLRTLSALGAANHELRLRVLLAAKEGTIRRRDLRTMAVTNPGSGTLQYHINHLLSANLLQRSARGEYGLTPSGRAVCELCDRLRLTKENSA
jgi:hypothetical protein